MAIALNIDCIFEPYGELDVVVVGFPRADEFCELMCGLGHGDADGFCGDRAGRLNAAIDPAGRRHLNFFSDNQLSYEI